MPGIAGIIGHRSPEEYPRLVDAMVQSMKSEPFYTSGTCFNPEIGVYGGWVAHQGSFAARQSAHADSDIRLLFSGEYFQSYQSSGASTCHDPRSKESDLDQLLKLYHEKGDSFVGEINGLFSGLLIDRKKKRALLFNDRYGIERIYFFEKNETIFFASEAKALLRILPELRGFDDEGVAQFLTYGCTLAGRTLFRNVRLLPGGSIWFFDGNARARKEQYFHIEDWESQSPLTEEAFELEFMDTFGRILPRYVPSDAPIGLSLTGGLDTRMIMACIPRNITKPVCYTFSGLTGQTLDVKLASRVANACGFEHHILPIGTDFLSNYGRYLDRTVFASDGCAGALTAHEIYFNSQARSLSQVRLTGNFGSEILRSMSTFKPISLSSSLLSSDVKGMVESGALNFANDEKIHPVKFAAFQEIPWNLFGSLAAGKSQLVFRTPYLDNEIVALAFRAPASSRQSPQSALRLVAQKNPGLGAIPTDRGLIWGDHGPGFMMRRLFSEVTFKLDYLHKEGLPHWLSPAEPLFDSLSRTGLLGLHKFLPYRLWFRNELSNYIAEVLTDADTQKMPYWNSNFLASIVSEHTCGQKNYIREIHTILTLESIERVLIRGSSESFENLSNECAEKI